ncbi:hypothetical protein GCM10007162_19240 [Ignatzschineria ureiclastica]|nr:hypothetical protein GCM10007162_19240 [Ignatzschineria ureiclastica]
MISPIIKSLYADQLLPASPLAAMAFETLALNSGKIGELNITPDLFSQFMKKGSK